MYVNEGALLVYDITDTDSFKKMTDWVKELRQMRGADLPIIIVGNKSDLESSRVVSKEQAEAYARKIGVDHHLASAKTGHNVNDIFRILTESKFLLSF